MRCARIASDGREELDDFYADGDIPSVLAGRPSLDPAATTHVVRSLFGDRRVTRIADVSLGDGNPPDDEVYAAVWPGVTVVCSRELAVDRPSVVDRRFLEAGAGRRIILHAMYSVIDWFAFAVWSPRGHLERALSLAPGDGVIENLGEPLAFEAPFWAGDRPALDDEDEDEDDDYALPFHPLELAGEAMGTLLGFVYEGDGPDLDPYDIALAAFSLMPHKSVPVGPTPPPPPRMPAPYNFWPPLRP